MPVGIDGPDQAYSPNGKAPRERNGQGTEALAALAMEPNRWLRVGVSLAAFARLVGLDASLVQLLDVSPHTRVK